MSFLGSDRSDSADTRGGYGASLATIFAIPKPFQGHTALIQRNALASWASLSPGITVVLFGDEPGVAEAATKHGFSHVPDIARNAQGTPLVSDAFAQIAQIGSSPYLAYCNADLLLGLDFAQAVRRLGESRLDRFLAIGRRLDVDITEPLDSANPADLQRVQDYARRGRLASIMCKDYFVYPRGEFSELPRFAVGRGNWDSWMVQTAKARGIPVVDLTACTTVLHQNHDHDHVAGGRAASYVFGAEARENQTAAGGRNWVQGATADWELTPQTLRRRRGASWHLPFWKDLPRAGRLVWSLLLDRSGRATNPGRSGE